MMPREGGSEEEHIRDDARPVVPEEPCPADPRGAAETQEERPGDPERNAGPLTPLGAGMWGPLCPCWGHAGARPPCPPTAGQRLVRGTPPHTYGWHPRHAGGMVLRPPAGLSGFGKPSPSTAPTCDPSGPLSGAPSSRPWCRGHRGPQGWSTRLSPSGICPEALGGPRQASGCPQRAWCSLEGPGVRRSFSVRPGWWGDPSQLRPAAPKTKRPSPSPTLHVRAPKGRTPALRQGGWAAQAAGRGGPSGVGGG